MPWKNDLTYGQNTDSSPETRYSVVLTVVRNTSWTFINNIPLKCISDDINNLTAWMWKNA